MSHSRAFTVGAEWPEFKQAENCGSTETISEPPETYGVLGSGCTARVAAYDTASVPASDSILRWAWHHHTHLVTQICCCTFCLTLCSTSRGLVSMICQCACCSQKRHIQNKLGHCMQRAHSLRTPPTALAPQLPQVAGSVKISAVDPGQACVSPGEQHNGSAIFYRQRNIHS